MGVELEHKMSREEQATEGGTPIICMAGVHAKKPGHAHATAVQGRPSPARIQPMPGVTGHRSVSRFDPDCVLNLEITGYHSCQGRDVTVPPPPRRRALARLEESRARGGRRPGFCGCRA